jgi:hypothetical protein
VEPKQRAEKVTKVTLPEYEAAAIALPEIKRTLTAYQMFLANDIR